MEQARAKTSDARCSGDARCCVVTLQEIRKCPHALKRWVLHLRNIFFLVWHRKFLRGSAENVTLL